LETKATLPCAFLAGEPAITVGRRWLVVEAETDNRKGSFSQPARLSEQPSQRTRQVSQIDSPDSAAVTALTTLSANRIGSQ
jgi:hypothetical protein